MLRDLIKREVKGNMVWEVLNQEKKMELQDICEEKQSFLERSIIYLWELYSHLKQLSIYLEPLHCMTQIPLSNT